jgi:uncharacterized protein YbaR (Trm112 family)
MTDNWRNRKHHIITSKSDKVVSGPGYVVDPSIISFALSDEQMQQQEQQQMQEQQRRQRQHKSIIPGPSVVARTQELMSHPVYCPCCKGNVWLVQSSATRRPRTLDTINKPLLECRVCGSWYKTRKWTALEAEDCIKDWKRSEQIDFRKNNNKT